MKIFTIALLTLSASLNAHAEAVCLDKVSSLAEKEMSSTQTSIELVQKFNNNGGVSTETYEVRDLRREDPAFHHGRYQRAPYRYFVTAIYTSDTNPVCEVQSFKVSN